MFATITTKPAPTQSLADLHLEVEGTLPAAVEGSFLQVNAHPAGGPGRPPMICGIRISGGRARLYRGGDALTVGLPGLQATTERYRVVIDLPVVPDRAAVLLGSPDRVVWQANRPTRIGLLPLAGGAARWFDVDACLVSRIVGAYEDGERVVVDAVRDGRVCRWELAGGRARARWLTGPVQQTTVDGARHRNIFATNVTEDGSVTLTRYDLTTWRTVERALGDNVRASAPAYVPGGWLGVLVADPVHRRSAVVVLSAENLAIRAVVHVPLAMPVSDTVCFAS
jgi:carotenoid cleavage dioxygenase-like enzyme